MRAALQWAFSGAGDVSAGVELAAWAAPLFIGLSLLDECTRWCERSLSCLDNAARGTRQELILQEAFALSSMYTSGNSDQVRAAIERVLALEEAFGDHRHRLQLLFGLHRLRMRLADFTGALEVAQQSATFAETANDSAGLAIADFMLGVCYHFIGDQAATQFFCERAIARATDPTTSIPNFFGFDQRTYAPTCLARALWLRGFADQARTIAKSAIDESLSRDDPLSICVSLTFSAPVFGLLRGALETLTALKMNILLTEFMGALAEGLRKRGRVDEAFLTINQAIERATGCGSTFDMAELLRIKAQLLAVMPLHGPASAMNCLTEALAVAKAQSALALELRSTIALARLLTEVGQRGQARNDLALVYGRFTEGLETRDLRVARELIEEMA